MKKLKKFLVVIILIVLSILALLIGQGYKMYKEAISSMSLSQKVESIKLQKDYTSLSEIPKIYTVAVISVEDHNVIGGLGSAISEVLTEEYPVKLVRMGINDTFGKSGKAIELMQYFGITAENIVEKVVK